MSTVSAPNILRRKAKDEKTQQWTREEAKERFKAFADSLDKRPKKSKLQHVFGKGAIRFLNTSKAPFRLSDYTARVKLNADYKDLSDADLEKDLTQLNLKEDDLGLVKVGEAGKRWGWINPKEKPGKVVEYLQEEIYKHKTPNEMYVVYCDALASLKHLTTTPKVILESNDEEPEAAYASFSKLEDGTILSDTELKQCRDALEKAITEEKNYHRKKGEWKTYFTDVVNAPKKFPQAMVGDWFGTIASKDMNDASIKADPKQIIFEHEDLPNDVNHRGDGLLIEGKVLKIMEFKTGPESPGGADSNSKFIKQADAYAQIIKQQIHAKKVKTTDDEGPFESCVYVFPTQDMAKKWGPELAKVFKTWKIADKLVVYPPALDNKNQPIATLKFNPTFQVPLKEAEGTSHHLVNPPVIHPGVNFKRIDLQTKAAGSSEIASGEVLFDIDLQGGLKAKDVKKPIKADGAGGTVENEKFPGLQSALDKVFKGRVEADAKLVDGGVSATLKVKEGPSGIPNLVLKGSTVTVTYINGQMTVDGSIELSNAKGTLHGKATATWDGKDFGFKGEATLEEGMVEGLARTTGTVEYVQGNWKFGIPETGYSKKFKGIELTGKAFGLEYDTKTGGFSGLLELDADLGAFGKASATAELKDNKLKKATLSYDSPEFTYPAKSEKPAFKGAIGGTITYTDGKFSGDIRGRANLNIPALKAVAGEEGAGLAINAHVNEDGSYSGTVATTSPLKFGKHLEVPSISCTLDKDGTLTGSFEIKVVKIKYLENAHVKCKVTKTGIEIEEADVSVAFGNQEKGKFWGTLKAGYKKETGLQIGGEVNYKIKDDMIATGTLKYEQAKNSVTLEMKVSEITLVDKKVSKTLFKASKQIPVVNVYGLGIYVDIGFDLGFDFGFKLTMTPEVDFVGLSLDTWHFEKIAAKLKIGGDVFAQLTGTPKLGIGVFALDPSILRGGGGLKVPIVGRLDIKPSGDFGVAYKNDGSIDGTAKLGLAGQFGITGSLKPYAEFAVLNDLWNPTWEGEALASFEILKPKELFNFTVDFAGDNKDLKKDGPALPEENAARAPVEPTGDKTAKAEPGKADEKGAGANKEQAAKKGEVEENGDQGPFSLDGLLDKFKGNKTVETVEKIFKIAKKVWAVVKPIYDLVEPLIDLIGKRINEFIDLFDTELPKSADDAIPWVWKVAKKVIGFAVGGLPELAAAIRKMFSKAAAFAKKLVTRAVKEGWIGVKRHSYYVWKPPPFDNYEFMAAAEYKINIPSVANIGHGGPDSILLTPSSAVAVVLYEALDSIGVGYTYVGNSDINKPYNDFWSGAGARG